MGFEEVDNLVKQFVGRRFFQQSDIFFREVTEI
jgi:hypothetical protein